MTTLAIHTPTDARSQAVCRNLWDLATPDQAEPEFEKLLAQSKQRFPEERFRRLPGVAVFAEDQTQLRDGRPVVYDAEAIEKIARNCNRRIAQFPWGPGGLAVERIYSVGAVCEPPLSP